MLPKKNVIFEQGVIFNIKYINFNDKFNINYKINKYEYSNGKVIINFILILKKNYFEVEKKYK